MPTLLSELLDEHQVFLTLQARNRDDALREIIDGLHHSGCVEDPEKFRQAILEREQVNSTILEDSVAFHHARTDFAKELILGIGRSREGISYPETTRKVELVFVMGVPKKRVQDYLICVGTLARLLRNPRVRNTLHSSDDPHQLVETLREASLALE